MNDKGGELLPIKTDKEWRVIETILETIQEESKKLSVILEEISAKEDIVSRALILFPEIFEKNNDKYKRTALWMCSRYSIINSSLRDVFSAGGKITKIGGVSFDKAVPKILYTLYLHKNIIIK